MAVDPARAARTFPTCLDDAEKTSGRTVTEMQKALNPSGLANHSGQRTFLMAVFGLGDGHGQAALTRF